MRIDGEKTISCFSATMNFTLDFFPVGIPVGCHMSHAETLKSIDFYNGDPKY